MKRSLSILLLVFGYSLQVCSQFKEVKRLTRTEGLPSNTVYRCAEDDQGFLWVCTNAGIARFDGKYFQNYTTNQGVPDNEVLQVDKEVNGRIWISSYRQEAAYFDTIKNRFINAKEDTLLQALSGSGYSRLNAMSNGGVRYFFNKSTLVFKDNKKYIYSHPDKGNGFFYMGDVFNNANVGLGGQKQLNANNQVVGYSSILYLINNNQVADSQLLFNGASDFMTINHNKAYILVIKDQKIVVLSNFKLNPLRSKIDSIRLKNRSHNFNICANYIAAINDLGNADIYNIHNGQYLFTLKGNFSINSVYEDHYGNFWVSTRNSGLIYFKKSNITDWSFNQNLNDRSFYSFSSDGCGRYFIGLDDNSVLEYKQGQIFKHEIGLGKNPGNVNYMKYIRNKLYAFSEHSGKIDFTTSIINPRTNLDILNYKGIKLLKDSSLILCGQGQLDWMNTINDSIYTHQQDIMINACAGLTQELIYTGSTDGLRYSIRHAALKRPMCKDPILYERVTDLFISPDSLLWVATSQHGIYGFKDEKVVVKIRATDGLMDDMINKITMDRLGQLWVATSKGVSKVKFVQHPLHYQIQNITQLDGLASNEVNNFYWLRDTMYVVTTKGISSMPLTINMPVYSIPIRVTAVTVNQKRMGIFDFYDLGYQENNIVLEIAGVEISGHFRQAEYILDGNTSWSLLEGHTLNLKLNSGRHELHLRSLDVNGNRGQEIRKIVFIVATPWWKSIWFWIISLSTLQIALGYLIYKRFKTKQRLKLEHDRARIELASLEQQAFTSLLNPHFIFNALNGLQHYINTADRQHTNKYLIKLSSLIRKSFELAQHSFITLDEELENLEQYLQLEQQRHTPSFNYVFEIEKDLDTEDEVMIPSMVLQPLVENAVVHGRLTLDEKGVLTLAVKRVSSGLRYSVTDNGIGLQKSKLLNQGRNHRSRGLALLQKRLAALSDLCGQEIKFNYDIPFEGNENPGHRVWFIIPDNLYEVWQGSKKGE